MAHRIRKVNYCYVTVPMRAGAGANVLGELKRAGINLLAFTGFPGKKGMAQLDLVTDNIAGIQRVAKKNGWRVSKTKKGFLAQGNDAVGVAHLHIRKLADKKINIVAADAVAAGQGRYGMILWVKPKDYTRAARVLGAK